MSFHIQRAHVRDLTKVKSLWMSMVASYRELAQDTWAVRDPAEAWQLRLQEYLEWINDATGVVFLALDEEGTAVGYAALRFVTSGAAVYLGEDVGELESLAVHPDRRGQGIGTALMNACRKELERREIAFWSLETLSANTAAVRLLERQGFETFKLRMVQRLDVDD